MIYALVALSNGRTLKDSISHLYTRSKMYRKWIFFFGLVAAVIQLTGYLTPSWIRHGTSEDYFAMGILYSCDSQKNCHVYSREDNRELMPTALYDITSPGRSDTFKWFRWDHLP